MVSPPNVTTVAGCDTYPYSSRFKFSPTSPYGMRCQGPADAQCDIYGQDIQSNPSDQHHRTSLGWDIDRGSVGGTSPLAATNDSYQCSPVNPIFVGWDNIYSVVGALLHAARHPFGDSDDRHLAVEEFDVRNEIDIEHYPVRGRMIVDNTHPSTLPVGRDVLTDLRQLMVNNGYDLAHGFDQYRVTYSAMDTVISYSPPITKPVPIGPNAPNPNDQAPDEVAKFDCQSLWGDSAREEKASMLLGTISGGVFGIYPLPNYTGLNPDPHGLDCIALPDEHLSASDLDLRIQGIGRLA